MCGRLRNRFRQRRHRREFVAELEVGDQRVVVLADFLDLAVFDADQEMIVVGVGAAVDQRAFAAMMTMQKIDVAAIEAAVRGS